jgi:hypothetical protein
MGRITAENLFQVFLAVLFLGLLFFPFQKSSEDMGITCYKNATLVSASFVGEHYDRSGISNHYVPDTWKVEVQIGGRTITSDSRAIYNNIVGQNSTELVVKVSKQKVFYKMVLFQEYEDYEYSLVE